MTLRRYAPMRRSTGTVIPLSLRREVLAADNGCVGPRVGMPGDCQGHIDLDHIRASHGIGLKSETTRRNLVSLCNNVHHRLKTEYGKTWRMPLLRYVERRDR